MIESLAANDPRHGVLAAKGHILVIGGPGCGKTTIALQKAVQYLETEARPGQAVLFLSFSRAAIARIAQAARIEVPRDKDHHLEMQTLHSFCWGILRSHGYLLGAPRCLQVLLPHDEKALSNGIEPNSPGWPAWERERERLFYQEGKTAFDLFAPKCSDLLARSGLIRGLIALRYPLVILDEAQDTGPDAWRCIEILAPLTQIICLADFGQQIFDHLPGVGPERIRAIESALHPLSINLGNDNNRCAGTDIQQFADNILAGSIKTGTYRDVGKLMYNPKRMDLGKLIRKALAIVLGTIKKKTGKASGKYSNSYACWAQRHSDFGGINIWPKTDSTQNIVR